LLSIIYSKYIYSTLFIQKIQPTPNNDEDPIPFIFSTVVVLNSNSKQLKTVKT